MFPVLAVAMGLIAGLAVALPLWRARVQAHADAAAANRAVQAARLEELQQDLEAGRLSPDAYGAARHDLEMDLAAGSAESSPESGGPRRVLAGVALLVVLGLSAGLYGFYGSWRTGVEGVDTASRDAVLDMVDQLAKRLHTPAGADDQQGWDTLGHSYMIMGRYPDALDAFDHARRLSHDSDPRELAAYAEALTLTHPGVFVDQAVPLFEKVLQSDPQNTQALWYGGLGALQRGDRRLAVQRWNAVLAQDPPAEYRRVIEKAIAAAGGTPQPVIAPGGIQVQLSIARSLASQVTPDSVVFVYAEPKQGSGGPPLAARRLQAGALPLELSLSDRDAVMPGRALSAYDDVLVSARISRSGTAETQPGDLIGRAEWRKASGKPLAIIIDTVVK